MFGWLLTRRRLGASVGATATIATTLSLGGRLAGGVVAMPLVILAGLILDVTASAALRRPIAKWRALLLLSSGAAAGNLVCFVKRLFESVGPFFSTSNIQDLRWAVMSYVLFGFLAGATGAAVAYAVLGYRAPLPNRAGNRQPRADQPVHLQILEEWLRSEGWQK